MTNEDMKIPLGATVADVVKIPELFGWITSYTWETQEYAQEYLTSDTILCLREPYNSQRSLRTRLREMFKHE